MSPPGLQHTLPPPGPLPQLCRLRGPRGEDPERRQRVGQLSNPGVSGLPQEAHDRLGTCSDSPPRSQMLHTTRSGYTETNRHVGCFFSVNRTLAVESQP